MMRRYLAGWRVDGGIEVAGVVRARDASEAVMLAHKRWPGAGVMPWRAANRRQRELALQERQETLKV